MNHQTSHPPRLLITLGDVAGVGPEVLVKAWPELTTFCRPVVVGDPGWVRRAMELLEGKSSVRALEGPTVAGTLHVPSPPPPPVRALKGVKTPDQAGADPEVIHFLEDRWRDLGNVQPGRVSAEAGQAAFDFLAHAINLTLAGLADGIVTLPLHKEGLHAAGLHYPGHTEILAEKTGASHYAMMLYARGPNLPHGLGVVHVTLHMALRRVFEHITTTAIMEKIHLLNEVMAKLKGGPPSLTLPHKGGGDKLKNPRIGVAALNPHASDGGLFGSEEAEVIGPAVAQARAAGLEVTGPWPADTLFVNAQRGEFDGVVAMYHDQGHIALKLLSGLRAVNVTLGLPIVRTSVAHGTAYDIAWKGVADHGSLLEAARVASLLAGMRSLS